MKRLLFIAGMLSFVINGSSQNATCLMGIRWSGTTVLSRHLQISSGTAADLSAIPGVSGIVQSENTVDLINKRYFLRTDQGIKVINSQNGQVLSTISSPIMLVNMEFNPNTGELIGLYWNGSAAQFASLNINTGLLSMNTLLSGITSFVQGESAFDPSSNRYFCRTNGVITVINANTGGIINTFNGSNFCGLEFNSNTNKLTGTCWNNLTNIFCNMDPSTGAITNVAIIPGVSGVEQGETAFDTGGNRYFTKTDLGTMIIDAATGSVTSVIPPSTQIHSIEYIGDPQACSISITSLSALQINTVFGGNVTFSISTSTQNPSYQWQCKTGNSSWSSVPNSSPFSGVNSNALNINPVTVQHQNQTFRVLVSQGDCSNSSAEFHLHLPDTIIVVDTGQVAGPDSLINNKITHLNNEISIKNLIVYPNPANSSVTIENRSTTDLSTYSIRIGNKMGQTFFKETIIHNKIQIDLSTISEKGILFIQFLNTKGIVVDVMKILVE